ncbi:MAG: MogA/MoaB family molybdenum cofactor biosynthesis protein [Bryobacteraceae bacterium]|nr:MogA/MoaB family molybdenum cofactor biosynthesis protein [Bryobacteraceae bacterium]
MIRAAILTVSDTGFLGMRKDVSGPALAARATELGWQVTVTALLPDEPDQIAAKLIELCGAANLILVTGGTGIATRDSTPEAARRVLDRELTGFGELMRAEGMKKTRLAALSRSLAGTRGRTLIVCVPGSPKGAVESLDAIADLIPHAVQLLAGGDPH